MATRLTRGMKICLALTGFNLFGLPFHFGLTTIPFLLPVALPLLHYSDGQGDFMMPMSSTLKLKEERFYFVHTLQFFLLLHLEDFFLFPIPHYLVMFCLLWSPIVPISYSNAYQTVLLEGEKPVKANLRQHGKFLGGICAWALIVSGGLSYSVIKDVLWKRIKENPNTQKE